MWHLKTKSYIRGWASQCNIQLWLCRSNMHNAPHKKTSICERTIISQPEPTAIVTGSSGRKTNLFTAIPTVICPRIPNPRCLGRPSSPPCLPLQLPPPHPAPPSLKSLPVLWSGATPPLTQGSGPPREGWAIPESLWCAALCPSVLMVQSPLSKATWELLSTPA